MNIKKVDDKPDRVGCLVLFQREGDKHGYWWQIDSVKSTRWSNMDCKSNKKSCLKRVIQFYHERLERRAASADLRCASAKDTGLRERKAEKMVRGQSRYRRRALHHLLPSVYPDIRRPEAGEICGMVRLQRQRQPPYPGAV